MAESVSSPIENSVTIPPQWQCEKFPIYGIPVNIIINHKRHLQERYK